MRTRLPFSFTHRLTKKVVIDCKNVTEDLLVHVSGTGYIDDNYSVLDIDDRYSVDIDSVHYEEQNILEVLRFFELMDEIELAACKHIARVYEERRAA